MAKHMGIIIYPLEDLPDKTKVDKDYSIKEFDLEKFIEDASFYSNVLSTSAERLVDMIGYIYI